MMKQTTWIVFFCICVTITLGEVGEVGEENEAENDELLYDVSHLLRKKDIMFLLHAIKDLSSKMIARNHFEFMLNKENNDSVVRRYIENEKMEYTMHGNCIHSLVKKYIKNKNINMIDYMLKNGIPIVLDCKGIEECKYLLPIVLQYPNTITYKKFMLNRVFHGDIDAFSLMLSKWPEQNRYKFYRDIMKIAGSNGHINFVKHIVEKLSDEDKKKLMKEPIQYDFKKIIGNFKNNKVRAEKVMYLLKYAYGYFNPCDKKTSMFLYNSVRNELLDLYMDKGMYAWNSGGQKVHLDLKGIIEYSYLFC